MQMSNFRELVPEMAIEYPFELDDFQKEAIAHLEQNENVFVAARKIETQTHSNPSKHQLAIQSASAKATHPPATENSCGVSVLVC